MGVSKSKRFSRFLLPIYCGVLMAGQSYALELNVSYRIVNVKSNKVLQPENNNDGAAVKQYTFNGSSSQLWHVTTEGDDEYIVYNNLTGLCLKIKNSGTASGTPIIASADNGTFDPSNRFILRYESTANPRQKYQLWNYNSDKYLDISGASTSDGAACIIWPLKSVDGANQQWIFVPTPDPNKYYNIFNLNSGKKLAPYYRATPGDYVVQYSEGIGAGLWRFAYAGDGYYYIINTVYGLYMDINGASTQQGALNILWNANGGDNQKWKLVDTSFNTITPIAYRIQNKKSGLYLDITGASMDDGARSLQWPYRSSGNSQVWLFNLYSY